MDIPLKKLLRLIHADHSVEVRAAALLILGEVGARDAEVNEVVSAALTDDEATVRQQALRAVGKLRIEQALPHLLERVKAGGEEAELAAEAAAHLGPKGTKALQDLMAKVAPGQRRYIAAALATGGTASAEAATMAVLMDTDPGVVTAAVRSLIEQIPTLTPAQRGAWTEHLLELLGNKKTRLAQPTEAGAVRLLAALDDPRASALLWERVLPPHPPEVRASALQALGEWTNTPTKEQLKRLFACATERDFRVVAPALLILKRLPAAEKAVAEWLDVMRSGDVVARQLAMEKVGERDTKDVAAALLEQTRHPDRALREGALARLTQLEHGRQALTTALLGAETADQAWLLARSQAPFAKDYPVEWREEVFAKACAHLQASDRRADALLFLLRETDAHDLRDRLEERALSCRKKKDYETALLYLRLLARDPALGFASRLELACCGLKVSSHELSAEARANDPCLQQFGLLLQQDDAELLAQIGKMKWLEPDELYYLGFHFAEEEGRAKKFGGAVLQLVVKRSARSKTGQAARSKLRSCGLD